MKRILTAAALALLTTAAIAAPAAPPDPVALYTGKYWKTSFFEGNSGGVPMCVTSGTWTFQNGSRGHAMLKWSNDLGLFMHIAKSTWRFAENIDVPMTITFDRDSRNGNGTTLQSATGNGMIQINVQPDAAAGFINEFAEANKMVITFRSGNEPPWVAQMEGTREAMQWLQKCIAYIGNNNSTSPVPPQATSPVAPQTSPLPSYAVPPTSPIPPTTKPVRNLPQGPDNRV